MSTKAAARGKIKAAVVAVIETATNRELADALDRVNRYRAYDFDYRRTAKRYTERAREQRENARKARERVEALRKAGSAVRGAARLSADVVLQQLAKHKGVASVHSMKGKLIVRTPLVFVPIRKEGGTKESERRCIGAFDVSFDPKAYRIRVHNRLFQGHWATNNDQPCLGEYEHEVHRLFKKGDFYLLYDLMWQWMIGADKDAHAYMRSHEWRDRRRSIGRVEARVEYNASDHVVCVDPEYDGREIGGYVAKIVVGGSAMVQIAFKKWDRDRGDSPTWNVPTYAIHKITSAEYEAADIYAVKSKRAKIALAIDTLPDGSKFGDAKKMVERVKSRTLELTKIA